MPKVKCVGIGIENYYAVGRKIEIMNVEGGKQMASHFFV
jgi:hypothetical protein